ncbi:8152_t:CDS:2 [Paraglomus brasilianum]|uniref:8152_t:CDS:1 n=1 Tax=Paraglomus brasilianum TaxID=144538 RepID=A0A9N9FQH1_9GLOM|nr:8152_t:CDS:2 [Paraglomus brasilianum]
MIPWTLQEDAQLRNLHSSHGSLWNRISEQINNRTARQCADRWHNYLSPNINTTPLTHFERQMNIADGQELLVFDETGGVQTYPSTNEP